MCSELFLLGGVLKMKHKRFQAAIIRRQQITILFLLFGMMGLVLLGCLLFGSMKAQAAPAEPVYKYYTSIQVGHGDTLWEIANAHMPPEYESVHAYMKEICETNNIADDAIHAGQYLTIPYYSHEYLE